MSKREHLSLDSRTGDATGPIRRKRADTLTLGLGAFQKISAVEDICVSDRLLADLRAMARKHPGEAARTRYSIVERGLTGVYRSVSEAHLHRYLAKFDFRYNNRSKLGCEDGERADRALRGIVGKRLTYRWLDA